MQNPGGGCEGNKVSGITEYCIPSIDGMLIHATELGYRRLINGFDSLESAGANFLNWRNSLVSEVTRKDKMFACCPYCTTVLQKATVAQSEQICPKCGRNMVVSIKNGRVMVFESEEDLRGEVNQAQAIRVKTYHNKLLEA